MHPDVGAARARWSAHSLLSPGQMAFADQLAMRSIPGRQLMLAAGKAVADRIRACWSPCPVRILCGPGNNGGDGFVVARILHEQGWPVRIGLLGSFDALQGDARHHAERCGLVPEPVSVSLLEGAELVVDALFGAGLARPLQGRAQDVVQALAASAIPVCAIDVPSGVDGASGQILGAAAPAQQTVTFFRKKPGHLLFPGRQLCGQVTLADIGIPAGVLEQLDVQVFENHPDLWRAAWPLRAGNEHKYQRGHVLIRGGASLTGAARLCALAAARMGAGLVSLAVPAHAWPVYASSMLSVMVHVCDGLPAWKQALADGRRNVVVIGPGAGLDAQLRAEVLAALGTQAAVVLDADALSIFSDAPEVLLGALRMPCVLTPHEGEFARLFSLSGSKLERAREAAKISGVVCVLKGADTVIASPDGRALINSNAPACLATAGSGDVLGGMIAGLLAQGMPAFEAAGAAVWCHGAAAQGFGPGLLAEDLPGQIPAVLRGFLHV